MLQYIFIETDFNKLWTIFWNNSKFLIKKKQPANQAFSILFKQEQTEIKLYTSFKQEKCVEDWPEDSPELSVDYKPVRNYSKSAHPTIFLSVSDKYLSFKSGKLRLRRESVKVGGTILPVAFSDIILLVCVRGSKITTWFFFYRIK